MFTQSLTGPIGSIAGLCTCVSMVPQLHSIWRSKSAKGVSSATYFIFGIGIALWLIYGIEIKSGPVIVANGTTMALVIAILILKFHYD